MRSACKLVMGGLLIGAAFGFTSQAYAQGGVDPDNLDLQAIVTSDSEADQKIARIKAIQKAIQDVMGDLSRTAISGDRKRAIYAAIEADGELIQDMRFRPMRGRAGSFQFTATASRQAFEEICFNALRVEETFGAQQFMIVALREVPWYDGPGLNQNQRFKVTGEAVELGASNFLTTHKFRKAPASSNAENVTQAAIALGTDPAASALKGFASMFNIPVVCSVGGTIRFVPYPAGTPQAQAFQGYLRVEGMKYRLYHRDSDTILADDTLNVDLTKNEPWQATTTMMPIFQVALNADLPGRVEDYSKLAGKMIGRNICNRLLNAFYSGQPDAAGTAAPAAGAAGPRQCPGCGDKVADASVAKCPACDSELPAATGGGAAPAGGAAMRNPRPTDYYQIRFVNWGDTDVDETVGALQDSNTGFGNWQDQGVSGNVKTYRCSYVGELIIRQINYALEEIGKKASAAVTKDGNTITITKSR